MTLPRPSLALVTAMLALLVAVGGTSYAAGLARNSVGTQQLKAQAVTTAKVKNGAVTGAKVKDRSIGAADLAPAAVPVKARVFARSLTGAPASTTLATIEGVRIGTSCERSFTTAGVVFDSASGGSDLQVSGQLVLKASSGPIQTLPFYPEPGTSVSVNAAEPFSGTAVGTFEGLVGRPGQRQLQVSVAVRWDSADTTTPCEVRVAVTPLG